MREIAYSVMFGLDRTLSPGMGSDLRIQPASLPQPKASKQSPPLIRTQRLGEWQKKTYRVFDVLLPFVPGYDNLPRASRREIPLDRK